MHVEVVTAYADWLKRPDCGVNAMLATIPLLAMDTAAPPPAVAGILDPYRDARALTFNEPAKYPALYVLPEGPVQLQGEAGPTVRRLRAPLAVTVRYLVQNADAPASARHAAYTLRALAKSTAAWLADDATARAARMNAGIYVESCEGITYGPWKETVGAATAVAVFALELRVRDTAPR